MAGEKLYKRCPQCGNRISLFRIREEFKCPYCGLYLKVQRAALAISVSLLSWFLIIGPLTLTIFQGSWFGWLFDLIIGGLFALLIFKGIVKLKTSEEEKP